MEAEVTAVVGGMVDAIEAELEPEAATARAAAREEQARLWPTFRSPWHYLMLDKW